MKLFSTSWNDTRRARGQDFLNYRVCSVAGDEHTGLGEEYTLTYGNIQDATCGIVKGQSERIAIPQFQLYNWSRYMYLAILCVAD